MEIADADKRAEWSFQTCCEIWEIQGRRKCQPFFRAIFDLCLQPLFSLREGCFRHDLERHQKMSGRFPQGLAAIGGHMHREMDKLRAKWNAKVQIATRDFENQERVRQQRALEEKSSAIQEAGEPDFFAQAFAPRQPDDTRNSHLPTGFASSAFTWKELEGRFLQVQARTSPRQNVHATLIQSEWDSGAIGREWIVGGNLSLRKEFESLATIAYRKLGSAPVNSPHEAWLDQVREWMEQTGLDKDHGSVWRPAGSVKKQGATGTTESLYSEKIAELSARFCMHLMAHGTPEFAGSPYSQNPVIADRQSPPRLPRRETRKTSKPSKRTAVIFGAIQSDIRGPKYCAALDARSLKLPDQWIEEGCPNSYVLAYKDARWRKRIQDEKCRYRKKYLETPDQEREKIIQGASGTRATRR